MQENTLKEKLYAEVPAEQRELFFDFKKSHPYVSIPIQNWTGQYIACGTGEKVLVFLHGALVEPDMWFYPILELEKNYKIIAPYFPSSRMGAREAVDLIRAALQREKVTKATFIGMSYGGGVAQYLAEKHPDWIEKLVLTHTGLLGRADSKAPINKMKTLVKFVPLFLLKMKLKQRIEYFPSSRWNEFHKAYFMDINARLTKRIFLDYSNSILRFVDEAGDVSDKQRNWQGPTTLLGSRDDKDASQYFEQLTALYPQAESYVFDEEGGHHMIFLFPEKYTDILSQYVA